VQLNAGGIVVPTRDSGTMALNIVGEMHVAPAIIAETPILVTGAQSQSHYHNHNNRNKLPHIISLNTLNKFVKSLNQFVFRN
jgi:hypothetical protein